MDLKLPRALSLIAPIGFLLAGGVCGSEGASATDSIPSPGSVDWAIALDAARSVAAEKASSAEELIERFERLVSLFEGCESCRKDYYRSLSYRLEREFHNRAAVLRAMEGQYADDPVELGRLYLVFGRPVEAARTAEHGSRIVYFVEQRVDLLEILAQARERLGNSGNEGVGTTRAETRAARPGSESRLAELRSSLSALVAANQTEEASEVARALIAQFSDHVSACEACETDWAFSTRGPGLLPGIEGWLRRCRSITDHCPERSAMWSRMLRRLPAEKEPLELLLARGLPGAVKPLLLLHLGGATRPANPERALELERQAIIHPEYPGVRGFWGKFSKDRFEWSRDIASTLFLELLNPPIERWCGDKCSSRPAHEFRVAYYKLLLQMEPERQWARMMELIPTSPEEQVARLFHCPEYLDRFVKAARCVHHEAAALDRFRELQVRYTELVERPGGQKASFSMYSYPPRAPRMLRELQLMVGGYIDELENPRSEAPIRKDNLSVPNGSFRLSESPDRSRRREGNEPSRDHGSPPKAHHCLVGPP